MEGADGREGELIDRGRVSVGGSMTYDRESMEVKLMNVAEHVLWRDAKMPVSQTK